MRADEEHVFDPTEEGEAMIGTPLTRIIEAEADAAESRLTEAALRGDIWTPGWVADFDVLLDSGTRYPVYVGHLTRLVTGDLRAMLAAGLRFPPVPAHLVGPFAEPPDRASLTTKEWIAQLRPLVEHWRRTR